MENSLTIGVDLGGTKLAIGIVDERGNVEHFSRTPIRDRESSSIVDLVDQQIRSILGNEKQKQKALQIGIGVAGQIDENGRDLRFAPNLGWSHVPLAEMIEKKTGIHCSLVNDVTAAGFGEWTFGCGQGVSNMVCVFVGTGVGGAIVSDGRMLKAAGELGHLTIAVEGRLCSCGHKGCLEAYAGGWALAKQAQQRVMADESSGAILLDLAGSIESIRAKTVVAALRKSDPLSIEIMAEAGNYLASGLVGIVNALNPELVVLGGGVIAGYPEWISKIAEHVKRFSLPDRAEKVKVCEAKLGSASAVVGAACWARQKSSLAAHIFREHDGKSKLASSN